jgi:hypothetical protein
MKPENSTIFMNKLVNFSFKKIGWIVGFLLCTFCQSPRQTDTAEEATEEYAEEAAEAMEAEEIAAAEPGEGYYKLQNLECRNNGYVILSNFYQVTRQQVDRMDQEQYYPGSLLDFSYDIRMRMARCVGGEAYAPDLLDRFFDLGLGEYSQEMRRDLMPYIEDEMTIVGVPFVNYAKEHLIPNPGEKQFNGLTYKYLYDYYSEEVRGLYSAYLMVSKYSSFEYELRRYATKAIRKAENGTIDNYASFNEMLARFRTPYWLQFEKVNYSKGNFTFYAAFWLRRGLDGSKDALVELIEAVLSKYDKEWLNEAKGKVRGFPLIKYVSSPTETMPPAEEQYITNRDSLTRFYETTEEGFVVNFENGESRTFENGEYYGHRVIGYVKSQHGIVVENENEYSTMTYYNLANGEGADFQYYMMETALSPDGKFLAATYQDIENIGAQFYEFKNGLPRKILTSDLLPTGRLHWVNETTVVMQTDEEGELMVEFLPSQQ